MAKPELRLKSLVKVPAALNYGPRIDRGYFLLLALLIILGIVMITHSGFQLKSDGSNYFAYLRSAVFDQDLDFHNEFTNFDKAFWATYKPKETVTGHYTNVFSVGPAILWAPFYLLAHLLVLVANLLGAQIKPDGLSPPYHLAVNSASLVYAFAGMCLVYKLCKKYYAALPALTATVTLWLATFMAYYTVYQPYMSHAVSFFTVTLFIYYWHSTRTGRNWPQWMLLGLTAALMMLVRWQNGLFMIFPALESLVLYSDHISQKDRASTLNLLKNNSLFLLFALVGFFPQMLAWKIIYGSFLTIPQGSGFFRWSAPFFSELLFSSRHGLYSWTPVVYLATFGWFLFYRRDRLFALCGLAAFLLMTYVNSVTADWWAGWGFGMRRFDGFIPLFALGLAQVLDSLKKLCPRFAFTFGIAVVLTFSGFNWFLMGQLNRGAIHPGGPVAFAKILGVSDTGIYRYTGYPFSFPANILFALRYKLPPNRYDTLVGGYIDDRYFYGDTIEFGENQPLLGNGWSTPARKRNTVFRSMQHQAVVYAPVRSVTRFVMVVRAAGLHPPLPEISVYLNGRQIGTVKPLQDWQDFTFTLSKENLISGINTLEFVNPDTKGSFDVEYIKFKRLEYVPDWK
ncbi:MAG: glycosyltransferase family protein [Eubacteriales bacterium]